MTARQRLPNRRCAATRELAWGQHHFSVTVGFDMDTGAVREVFVADGGRSGTDLQNTLQDACVVVSVALQYGVPVEALTRSLGRVPAPFGGGDVPASAIGAVLEAVAQEAGQ